MFYLVLYKTAHGYNLNSCLINCYSNGPVSELHHQIRMLSAVEFLVHEAPIMLTKSST